MEQLSIDSVDLLLLDQLQRDASLTNLALAERTHISAPTCLRRVKRLRELGLIEQQIAVLNTERLNTVSGQALAAIVEVSLERQDAQALTAFEERVAADDAVQQCYRVSPGPDFVLVVHVRDMPDYLALAQRLFTADANVRNVKAFFSIKRSKFGCRLPLPKPVPRAG